MQQNKYLALVAATAFLLNSCNVKDYENTTHAADSYTPAAITEDEATEAKSEISLQGDERKLIHTMDVKFRTDDVQHSVVMIERFAHRNSGIVEESKTTNHTFDTKSVAYKADSLKTKTVYTTKALMTVRIPVEQIDTFSRLLTGLSQFTDYRNLNREDVTFNLIGNKLKSSADETTRKALGKNNSEKNFDKTIDYTNRIAQQDADRQLQNIQLLDEVRYATVSLELYQPDRVYASVIQDVNGMAQQTYAESAGIALKWSIELIRGLSLFLIYIWPVWLVALIVLLIVKRKKKILTA